MAFDSTPYSMLKTVVMMIGEYEFEGIFTEHDNPEETEAANLEAAKMIPFPTYSSLVFLKSVSFLFHSIPRKRESKFLFLLFLFLFLFPFLVLQ